MFGCSDYPGYKYNDGAKPSPQPIWGEIDERDLVLGGDCHLESINDKPSESQSSHLIIQNGAALKVVGWAAISGSKGISATDIAVALNPISGNGTRSFVDTIKVKRPDVADYFKNAGIVDSGFKAAIDLTDMLPGDYQLEIIQHRDKTNYKCQYAANLVLKK
ncbi:MAG: hypothetical protein ABL903_09415 [Methylococcales bacterium]